MLTTRFYQPRFETPNSRQVSTVNYAVSLADFKEWIKWGDDTSEDNTMNNCLYGAVLWAQSFTRRQLFRSVWRSYLPFFCNVRLDIHPVDVSSIVVKYYDVDNVLQTLGAAEYFIQENGEDQYTEIRFDGTMPSLFDRWEPVYIEYTAGYVTIPEAIVTNIYKYAATDFENRQNEQSGSVDTTTFGSLQGLYHYKML